jgi:hypothetical protein
MITFPSQGGTTKYYVKAADNGNPAGITISSDAYHWLSYNVSDVASNNLIKEITISATANSSSKKRANFIILGISGSTQCKDMKNHIECVQDGMQECAITLNGSSKDITETNLPGTGFTKSYTLGGSCTNFTVSSDNNIASISNGKLIIKIPKNSGDASITYTGTVSIDCSDICADGQKEIKFSFTQLTLNDCYINVGDYTSDTVIAISSTAYNKSFTINASCSVEIVDALDGVTLNGNLLTIAFGENKTTSPISHVVKLKLNDNCDCKKGTPEITLTFNQDSKTDCTLSLNPSTLDTIQFASGASSTTVSFSSTHTLNGNTIAEPWKAIISGDKGFTFDNNVTTITGVGGTNCTVNVNVSENTGEIRESTTLAITQTGTCNEEKTIALKQTPKITCTLAISNNNTYYTPASTNIAIINASGITVCTIPYSSTTNNDDCDVNLVENDTTLCTTTIDKASHTLKINYNTTNPNAVDSRVTTFTLSQVCTQCTDNKLIFKVSQIPNNAIDINGDFFVATYAWEGAADMDTVTVIDEKIPISVGSTSYFNAYPVGYNKVGNNNVTIQKYLEYGGDTTKSGDETVLINIKELKSYISANPKYINTLREEQRNNGQAIMRIEIYGNWFGAQPSNNNTSMSYKIYENGTMSLSSNGESHLFINTDGNDKTPSTASPVVMPVYSQTQANSNGNAWISAYTNVAEIQINFDTGISFLTKLDNGSKGQNTIFMLSQPSDSSVYRYNFYNIYDSSHNRYQYVMYSGENSSYFSTGEYSFTVGITSSINNVRASYSATSVPDGFSVTPDSTHDYFTLNMPDTSTYDGLTNVFSIDLQQIEAPQNIIQLAVFKDKKKTIISEIEVNYTGVTYGISSTIYNPLIFTKDGTIEETNGKLYVECLNNNVITGANLATSSTVINNLPSSVNDKTPFILTLASNTTISERIETFTATSMANTSITAKGYLLQRGTYAFGFSSSNDSRWSIYSKEAMLGSLLGGVDGLPYAGGSINLNIISTDATGAAKDYSISSLTSVHENGQIIAVINGTTITITAPDKTQAIPSYISFDIVQNDSNNTRHIEVYQQLK